MREAKSKANDISAIDVTWQTNFRSAFEKNFDDPNFQSIFDQDEWLRNSNKIFDFRNTIHNNMQRERLLIEQLKAEF